MCSIEKLTLIFVDCEADGPCPGIGRCTEFGAVEFKSRKSFHGVLKSVLDRRFPEKQEYRDDYKVFKEFNYWLIQFDRPFIFVSDNNGYDWQWINYGFHHTLGFNPFGHSSRRISDFYAGLIGDFRKSQGWKRLRITKHDHHPVHDAMGNAEAFARILNGER